MGAIAAGDTYKMEFTPVNAGSVVITDGSDEYHDDGEGKILDASNVQKGTIDYATGIITSTASTGFALTDGSLNYTYNNQDCPVKVPQLKLEVSKLLLNAKAYTLGYTYSTFAAFNLLRTQNVDLKDLLGEGAANELVAEIDALVYKDFEDVANLSSTQGTTFNMNSTGYFSEHEYKPLNVLLCRNAYQN